MTTNNIPKNSVIYVPSGPAAEYAHLACNLYIGCWFGCKYCYAPAIAYKKLSDWSANPQPKKNILERLERDAKRMAGDPRPVLFCFTSDPYQNLGAAATTRRALLILEKYDMTATVLTKGDALASRDFDILQRNNWEFGVTLSCVWASRQRKWEPFAPTPYSRIHNLANAHRMGIKTWVSMEPVYDTKQALETIRRCHKYVDFWKIGKMNHRKLDIDWAKFLVDVTELCDRLGLDYYIKKELAAYGEGTK